MHSIPINPLAQPDCQSQINGFNPQTSVCGQPQVDACQADVGSALACNNGNGNYLLKGIYSTENQCNSPQQVVTFAKMDVQWLKSAMGSKSPLGAQLSQPIDQHSGYPKQAPNNPQQRYQTQQPNQAQSQVSYDIQSTQAPSYLPPRQK